MVVERSRFILHPPSADVQPAPQIFKIACIDWRGANVGTRNFFCNQTQRGRIERVVAPSTDILIAVLESFREFFGSAIGM
jgi:hypothetical protein